MLFADRLTLDKARRNSDGFMAIHARAARTGVYQYLGREIDPEGAHFVGDAVVNVYRPPDEVFDKASLGSFVGRPITDDHPAAGVDASNWRDLAHGVIMGAAKDGEYVGFDMAFMDAGLIAKIDDGKRELSNGYAAQLDIEDGIAPDGTAYQAVQRNIRGNHVAVVKAGRAGSACCIGDAAICAPIPSDAVREFLIDQRTYDEARDRDKNQATNSGDRTVPKLILIDGHQIDISNVDVAEATINKLTTDRNEAVAARTAADGKVAQLTADNATLTTERDNAAKALADAKITPADLRAAAKSFADVVGKAKALGVDVADEADEGEIKRAVVDAKLGDDAKGYTEDQVAIAFTALTKDAKPVADAQPDPLAARIASGGGARPMVTDAKAGLADARRASLAAKENAYLGSQD